jgi:uncharacterized protein (TIGR03085 family)
MPNVARAERSALCDTFLAVGPDAPTLAGDWKTRDLAAHLVIRERRPDAAAGIFVPPLADHAEKVRHAIADQPWDQLVDTVRTGPPPWSPVRLDVIDVLVNTVEMYVHHEDVRRATDPWEPRQLDHALAEELWNALRRMARVLVRNAPTGVVLARPGRGEIVARKAQPSVTVNGPPGELVLFAYGRQAKAKVDVVAPEDVAESLRTAKLGL